MDNTEKNVDPIEYAHRLHRRRVGAMSETEKNFLATAQRERNDQELAELILGKPTTAR